MEFVQYLYERIILKLPVVMLKPLSAILKDFFTDSFVIAWLFIFCCAFGYLLMYFLIKSDAQANNTQANSAINNTLPNYNKQANNGTFVINNSQANNDTSGNNNRKMDTSNKATQTLSYYKNRGRTLTRRMLLLEEIQVHHGH